MGIVDKYGKLKIRNNQLVDNNLNPIQLRGISSFSLGEDKYKITLDTIRFLVDNFKINCFRIAMLVDGDKGYINNYNLKNKVEGIIEHALKLDIYCIVDWHIYYEGNPLKYINESKSFFNEISKKYGQYNNIIYEICNEPHDDAWNDIIKPYAEELIKVIRNNDKDNIIIVGTPNWSNDIDKIKKINADNLMYTYHFYPTGNAEKDNLNIQKIPNAIKNEIPVFVTEYGIGDAYGKKLYNDTGKRFIETLNKYNLSYICWALSNNDNTLALLKHNVLDYSNLSIEDLSDSGVLIRQYYEE